MQTTNQAEVTRRRRFEGGVRASLAACAGLSIVVTLGIIVILVSQAWTFFTDPLAGANPLDAARKFLFGTVWTPLQKPQHFGVLPLVWGSLLVTAGAALVAIPCGVGTAIYLGEYATDGFRSFIKPILEILAGIPTVVYGFFALAVVTPALRLVFGADRVDVFNAASASLVVGIMVLPLVASLCDDAFRAVPDAIRQAAYALGATRNEVAWQVMLPAALSGVFASFVLALSRAIGETMAVVLAAGALPQIVANPFKSIQTMTAYIVQVSLGDTPTGGIEYKTIFAVGLLLFAITLVLNVVADQVMRRYREEYD